ncbi:reverse transcriptase-like protein [Fictibacillus sp. WQ 8-8]|uniref:reverse transcriptase-like protein n=1 Tax=Fictibacillus sp. WQ 8-8 TaxID=2938788 RepID=UPI00210D138D|nr:reverse transcriptase-like protein [Fictibacillus sp. WQ 8-8]MCQ6267204.1 reverse transcriptase-like protein [Fictibacillus sp. WQ 8-8]
MIEVYIDGASAGDPGPSGAGIFIKLGNGTVEKHSIPLGSLSNHEAEFRGLLLALTICVEKNYDPVSFRTDSQAVERAVEKRFAKDKRYDPLLQEALHMIDQLQLFFLKWIPSKQNKVADDLARKAVQLNEVQ